ncbi:MULTISPECIES: hypothetical protein [unclassified Streptomyces]|uniref:hypothetical protein n=1 Tax=unclassified Streptomyces TaxID=2593676 RepID=UPI0023662216|nr:MULTISPECIES: hypothetical protein [unclassified Streptomyces]MDF3147542.1 hypothetical protein [Streptomyces sp. T21Q-yed]WDF35472.1 hypothetical protein PBV52_00960 [Streptomyces sp. T12]
MPRIFAALLTCVLSAALAAGAAFGLVAALTATPEQPNVPLVTFPDPAGDRSAPVPAPRTQIADR